MTRRQQGFTLVEIAIVLVIIGLLLGGILKGQELINSARVRNIADTNSGIQAAYFGFVDRFRRVPGDWCADATATSAASCATDNAETAIGQPINSGGNNNGRLDAVGSNNWQEPSAMWEHLWKAGFIAGSYDGVSGTGAPANADAYRDAGSPTNPFNGSMILARTDDYLVETGTASPRLNLVLGRGIPVNIARELDTKVDDGRPLTGIMRLTVATGATYPDVGEYDAGPPDCRLATANDYDIANDAQDCNLVYLY